MTMDSELTDLNGTTKRDQLARAEALQLFRDLQQRPQLLAHLHALMNRYVRLGDLTHYISPAHPVWDDLEIAEPALGICAYDRLKQHGVRSPCVLFKQHSSDCAFGAIRIAPTLNERWALWTLSLLAKADSPAPG